MRAGAVRPNTPILHHSITPRNSLPVPACEICQEELPAAAAACRSCGAPPRLDWGKARIPPLPVGTKLQGGHYTVGRVVGRGGFGVTYMGSDARRRQPVAVKEYVTDGYSGQGCQRGEE